MTTTEFQQRYPKPWRFVFADRSFALRASNHIIICRLDLNNGHPGIPQAEWNRHVAAGLQEHIPVVEHNDATDSRKAAIERKLLQ